MKLYRTSRKRGRSVLAAQAHELAAHTERLLLGA